MSLLDDEEDILKVSDGLVEKTILTEFIEKYMVSSSNYPIFYEYYLIPCGESGALCTCLGV